MKCKHKYDGYQANFSPPTQQLKSFRSESSDQIEAMNYTLYGLTTVTQTCTQCGQARSYTIPGPVE